MEPDQIHFIWGRRGNSHFDFFDALVESTLELTTSNIVFLLGFLFLSDYSHADPFNIY